MLETIDAWATADPVPEPAALVEAREAGVRAALRSRGVDERYLEVGSRR